MRLNMLIIFFIGIFGGSVTAQNLDKNSPLIGEWECGKGLEAECGSYFSPDFAFPVKTFILAAGKDYSMMAYHYDETEKGYSNMYFFIASYDGEKLTGTVNSEGIQSQISVDLKYNKAKDQITITSVDYKEETLTISYYRVKKR